LAADRRRAAAERQRCDQRRTDIRAWMANAHESLPHRICLDLTYNSDPARVAEQVGNPRPTGGCQPVQSIGFPHFSKRGIDTTILWVGGYGHGRYMNAQTLYVSQELGIVHGLRCRAPTLSSSRHDRARASRQDHALPGSADPFKQTGLYASREIVLSSRFRRNRVPRFVCWRLRSRVRPIRRRYCE
jgi:hypothetical protein